MLVDALYWCVVFAGLVFLAIVAMFAICALGLDRYFTPEWEADEFDRSHSHRERLGR